MGNDSVAAIQADLEALNLALNEQCLAIRRGLQSTQRTGAIFADHPLATAAESISLLRRFMGEDRDGDRRERTSRLYYACIGQFIRLELLMMDEMIDQFLVRVGIKIDGEHLTFAGMPPWIMVEEDFNRREMLRERALPLLRKGGELKAKAWKATLRILREDFGYPNYLRFCEDKKGVDLDLLALTCRAFLESTDKLYEEHISAWVSERMDRPFERISRYHAIYLLHLRDFDRGFPGEKLMTSLRESLELFGIQDSLEKRLFIDMEEREGKSRLSRCVPLRIPQEIYVTFRPMGGLSDYETAFHEMGHGLHFANMDSRLPYAYRHLPRSFALSECFGFLFQNLMFERAWLGAHTDLSPKEIETLRHYRTLRDLCLIRRYMGKYLFEHELFSTGNIEDGGIYTRWLERATGFVYEPEAALMDLEEECYSVDYLKAWIGEAILRTYLRENFGDEWFTKGEAASFLAELWRGGEKWGLDDLLKALSRDPLDLSPLEQSFAGLSAPI